MNPARADCGEKSSGSRRKSHVIARYCEDLQHRSGRFGATRCRARFNQRLRSLWLNLARADCGEKSSGSRRKSHVIARYCEDLQLSLIHI